MCVLIELDDVVDDRPCLLASQRLEVRQEGAVTRDVGFGLLVEAGVNRIVGPLEQECFTVLDEFYALVRILAIEVVQRIPRHDHRRGDIVLHLYLVRRVEIRAQFENSPGALWIEPHP